MSHPDYFQKADISPVSPTKLILTKKHKKMKKPSSCCLGCTNSIREKYMLSIRGSTWHESCALCCICSAPLSSTCYFKDNQLFCKEDYNRLHAPHCANCNQSIISGERVTRSHPHIFHTACFQCTVCCRPLAPGDPYVLLPSSTCVTLVCKQDFINGGDCNVPKSPLSGSTKRSRTSLTTDQHTLFMSTFLKNPKPPKKLREQLASTAGVSSRVVQVWFQNQRVKDKKKSSQFDVHVATDISQQPENAAEKQFAFEVEYGNSMSIHSDSSQLCSSLKSLHDD